MLGSVLLFTRAVGIPDFALISDMCGQGLLVNIRERLQSNKSFDIGDSALDTRKGAWVALFARMESLAALEEPWTLVIKCALSPAPDHHCVCLPLGRPRVLSEVCILQNARKLQSPKLWSSSAP